MTATLTIERLTSGDEARLRRTRLMALQDAPEAFGSTFEETVQRPPESWVAQLRELPTWVACCDGVEVGMVRCEVEATELHLISLWVSPHVRGQGVGDALVRAVVEHGRSLGAGAVTLSVKSANIQAKALYARHGFELDGRPADSGCEERFTVSLFATP